MKVVVVWLAVLGLLLSVTPAADAAKSDQTACRKVPSGKRVVKVTLKPDTEIGDLLAWISSITCKQFVLSASIDTRNKKVTIIAPQPITADEAYRLFLDSLDSVGLTVVPTGKFLRVIETAKAKTSAIPVYLDKVDEPDSKP